MAKSNHSTALPIDAPVTAFRISDGIATLLKVSVPLSISLTEAQVTSLKKIAAMSLACCRCL
jgi:hypothetical protein